MRRRCPFQGGSGRVGSVVVYSRDTTGTDAVVQDDDTGNDGATLLLTETDEGKVKHAEDMEEGEGAGVGFGWQQALVVGVCAVILGFVSLHPFMRADWSAKAIEVVLQRLDYIGTIVFAISGTLKAARNKLDLLGCLVMGVCTGVGGGTLRDVLLGRLPVFWLSQTEYLWISIITAVATFIMAHYGRLRSSTTSFILHWGDAIGLGAFAVIGAQAAMSVGINTWVAPLFGMMTATFGGLIRDVCCRVPPVVLVAGEVYATSAFFGAAIFVLATQVSGCIPVGIVWGVVSTVLIRSACFTYDVRLPTLQIA